GVLEGSPAHVFSMPVGVVSNAQLVEKPRVVRSGAGQDSPIFVRIFDLMVSILSCVAVSGQGPARVPMFCLSMHLPTCFRYVFLNLSRFLTICFWQLAGSAFAEATSNRVAVMAPISCRKHVI